MTDRQRPRRRARVWYLVLGPLALIVAILNFVLWLTDTGAPYTFFHWVQLATALIFAAIGVLSLLAARSIKGGWH